MSGFVYTDECEFAGLDPKKVASIARRISRAAQEARALGITVFGGSGSGTLRWHAEYSDRNDQGPIVLAELDGCFDGGDGSTHTDADGFLRGEDGR